MEAVRQWAFSLCAAMVVCGVAKQLLPKSSMEGMLKLVVSVFFLCCLLSPIMMQNPQIRLELEEYAQEQINEKTRRLEAVVEEQTQTAAARNAEKIVEQKLRQMGIKYSAITININTNGQSEEAGSVVVTLGESLLPQREEIAGKLESALQMEVRLDFSAENGEG